VLILVFACFKFCHYKLSSLCTVACQYDVIKYMMQRPILSGRIGKWVYSLVENDLLYEPVKAMKGHIVADFIVDHSVDTNDMSLVASCPWKLFFDGSVCANGCGVGCLIISPKGISRGFSVCLEYSYTNNQVEYEALIVGLEYLVTMGVKHVEAYGDSQLVVQQINGSSKCLDDTLNFHRD
jgi:hypothetical protein